MADVPTTRRPRTGRRTRTSYHHGDLGPALVREAARTIRTAGVEAVTLRDVGRRLGVSRTALYRHFADKSGLLAAVAREGFQAFSRALRGAWDEAGGGLEGLRAMGTVYIRFARTEPAHYRIMFGQYRALCESDAALAADAAASFDVLLDALAALEATARSLLPLIVPRWRDTSGRPCTVSPCCRLTGSWDRIRRQPTR